MKRKVLRLTENDLHNIIKESVTRIISEVSMRDYIYGVADDLKSKLPSDMTNEELKEAISFLKQYPWSMGEDTTVLDDFIDEYKWRIESHTDKEDEDE